MFDIGWSELLVIGVVALLVVGPKELPALLRTIGKYVGILKRQANEFRAQFDEAMRETELEQLRKEVESLKSDAESTLREAEQSVQSEIADAKVEFDTAAEAAGSPPIKADGAEKANGPEAQADAPAAPGQEKAVQAESINGSGGHAYNGAAVQPPEPEAEPAAKTGA
jgi:sec-independent protein translocase protein TatB